MIVRVAKPPLRSLLRWVQAALFACAISLLGYCAYVQLDSWNFQRLTLQEFPDPAVAAEQKPIPATVYQVARPLARGALGRIDVPRLGISVVVVEGTSAAILRRGAGHIHGTALPGEPGNTAISAHRDTFFRPLRNIRRDDVITVTTVDGLYRYRVISTKIVTPSDLSVLDQGGKEALTLVTCYPFYFVGAAPSRFIVRAERIDRSS